MEENLLSSWEVYFDKSQACPVPRKFPISINKPSEQMTLEEVDEDTLLDSVVEGQGKLSYNFTEVSNEGWVLMKEPSFRVFDGSANKNRCIYLKSSSEIKHSKQILLEDENHGCFATNTPAETYDESKATFRSDSANSSEHSDEIMDKELPNEHQQGSLEAQHSVGPTLVGKDSPVSSFEKQERRESSGIGSEEEQLTQEDEPCTTPYVLQEAQILKDDTLLAKSLTLHEVKELKKVVFGSSQHSFDELWVNERIVFSGNDSYRIQFYKDGPVVLLACLQAYILKHHVFNNRTKKEQGGTEVSEDTDSALVLAITDMLWKAGQHTVAKVVMCKDNSPFGQDTDYLEDGISEKLCAFEFTEVEMLRNFCHQHLKYFQDSPGCILLLYSIVLSRTVERLLNDMGEDSCLLTKDGSATQAFINLLLTGTATDYVFNGEQESQKNPSREVCVVKGVEKRSEIGFLHLEEYHDIKKFEVGSRFKTPILPIWVLRFNDYIIAVHSMRKDLLNNWKLERRFDLHCNLPESRHLRFQQNNITLTLDTTSQFESDEEEEFSALESTLRTKWNDAKILWNGSVRF